MIGLKAFFRAHKKLHIWLLTDLALLALFLLIRHHRALMNALANRVTTPLRRAIGSLCYRTDVCVMEVLVCLLLLFSAAYLLWYLVLIVKGPRRLHRLYGCFVGTVCIALTVYVGFCFLWGVDYYTDSFQDKSGIVAQPVSVDDLYQVTAYFAQQLQDTADQVSRDSNGVFDVDRDEILQESTTVYDNVTKQFPFLAFPDRVPKKVYFSKVMSAANFTGFYCPYTGESCLNVDSPDSLLPATIAHELGHQRSFSSEQECNFLAVLASTTSGNVTFAYSGWLLGYIHLGNALYDADRDLWTRTRALLPDTVVADLQANNDYWKQYSGPAASASQNVYDKFLKSYGETAGVKSYGTVVDLLVVYYKDAAEK